VGVVESGRRAQASAFALIGTETQQRRDVSGAVKLGIIFNVKQLHVAADGGGYDGFRYVFDFAGFVATGRAVPHHMRVEVSAICALYRQMRELIAD
jgi:hypothetical protein